MPQAAQDISRVTSLLLEADALLVTAGAGMSVDSGLPDYRSNNGFWRAYPPLERLNVSFEQMAQPWWFDQRPRMAWAWYGHRQQLYRDSTPHEGYRLLREWMQVVPAGGFVVTSNVDGQFFAADFPSDRVLELHGNIHYYQCTVPCSDFLWTDDPPALDIDLESLSALGKLPSCPQCGALARPNVLMFNDDRWIAKDARDQEQRLRRWLAEITGKKLLIIECGAGQAIPAIRRLSETLAKEPNVTLARINLAEEPVASDVHHIRGSALEGLLAIESLLPATFRAKPIKPETATEASNELQHAWIEDRLKMKPGGAVSTGPANHLKAIKYEKVYAKAWQLTLPSGWVAWVDHFDVMTLNLGMSAGLPGRGAIASEIRAAREFVLKTFYGPEPVVLQPRIFDRHSDTPIMPLMRFAAQICTFEGLNKSDEGSWINLIWFADADDSKTLVQCVQDALAQIDWKKCASGYNS